VPVRAGCPPPATAKVVVLGGINDFEFSTTMSNLTTGTPLTDLITTLPAAERYVCSHEGNSQVLDHICTSGSFTSTDYDVVHVNAEFADRASDHDPRSYAYASDQSATRGGPAHRVAA
jgi:uncharacterized protein